MGLRSLICKDGKDPSSGKRSCSPLVNNMLAKALPPLFYYVSRAQPPPSLYNFKLQMAPKSTLKIYSNLSSQSFQYVGGTIT